MGYGLFCTLSNIDEIQDRQRFRQEEQQSTLFCRVGNRSPSGGPHNRRHSSFDTERGITYWLTEATILKGWTLAEKGQAEEGLI